MGSRPFSVDVLHVGFGPVPADAAVRLGVAAGDEVVVRRRRYLVEGQPVELATSYIPADIGRGTTGPDAERGRGRCCH